MKSLGGTVGKKEPLAKHTEVEGSREASCDDVSSVIPRGQGQGNVQSWEGNTALHAHERTDTPIIL